MNDPQTFGPFVIITLAALASYASRALGTLLSGRVRADSPVIEWITAVTYALMAGLVARMILLPQGALRDTADWVRLAAALVGLLVFFATRRSVGLSVLAGSLTLLALTWRW